VAGVRSPNRQSTIGGRQSLSLLAVDCELSTVDSAVALRLRRATLCPMHHRPPAKTILLSTLICCSAAAGVARAGNAFDAEVAARRAEASRLAGRAEA